VIDEDSIRVQIEQAYAAALPSYHEMDVDSSDLADIVRDVLAGLTPREAKVLRMRFGIDMAHDYTLDQIGRQFGVTCERARQIEAKALRKLRHPSRSARFREFLTGDAIGCRYLRGATYVPPDNEDVFNTLLADLRERHNDGKITFDEAQRACDDFSEWERTYQQAPELQSAAL
jgi:hypothetical protein